MLFFILRGLLFLIMILLPLVHPGVFLPYDWFWGVNLFSIIPLGMAGGVLFPLKKVSLKVQVLTLLIFPLLLSILLMGLPFGMGGFKAEPLITYGIFMASFFLTWFLYHRKSLWAGILEPFLMALFAYRLMEYFRASSDLVMDQSYLPALFFFLILFLFFSHTLLVTLWVGRDGAKFRLKESAVLGTGVLMAILVSLVVIQPDFLIHDIVENMGKSLPDPVLEPRDPGDQLGAELVEGGLEPADGEAELYSVPSEFYDTAAGQMRQYAVMLVHTNAPSLYLTGEYYGHFDAADGFVFSEAEPLNEVKDRRYLDVFTADPPQGQRRYRVDYEIFSYLSEKYFPYTPAIIEPTLYQSQWAPFQYIHKGTSATAFLGEEDLQGLRDYSPDELEEMKDYLTVPLLPQDRAIFQAFLDENLEEGMEVGERVLAILDGFRVFQYELGFDENVGVEKIGRFLTTDRVGDCTEFSNATAILARMAGIPTRVVTGYLASPGLQTMAHLQAVRSLRDQIPPLQEYLPQEILLVTTAHRHSWTQVWLPDVGWFDLETTSTAIPPESGMDPNDMDLVIPQIQPERVDRPDFIIPWGLIFMLLLSTAGLSISGLYLIRYGKLLVLTLGSKGQGLPAVIYLFRRLLYNMALDGYPAKPRDLTPLEFAQQFPALEEFAQNYSKLRYSLDPPFEDLEGLRRLYKATWKKLKKPGIGAFFLRGFRIKGLNL